MAVLEYAQNVLELKDASSTEFGGEQSNDERGSIIWLDD